MSKNSIDEDLLSCSESISNESITKGISISGIYDVISDPIKGGMGSVWKVHHNGWNMDLAMKRPLPKYFAEGSERRKENFIRECEDWIDLGLHPNIVSCFYVREIGGVPTIFSEWMENGSLESRIEDQTLYSGTDKAVQERLLDIAIQFARGLHYAHESKKGLIHQDVKPDNLLLTLGWDAKVADFGLARARTKLEEDSRDDSRDSVTTGAVAGAVQAAAPGAALMVAYSGCTPAYCSYEQDAKKPVSRQTDIYSWALSVLEMYLGSRPWKSGPEAGNRFRVYLKEERFRVKMPDGMRELLEQCLAEDPGERPQDFGGIIAKLQDIYQETIGEVYPRPEPDAAPDTADSLNNRALSYLDLGKDDQAEGLWEQALEKDAALADAVFNRALFLRRNRRISYNEAEDLLLSIPNYLTRDDYLKALIKERRVLDLDTDYFCGDRDHKGLNFTCFSDDRRRGAGIWAVRDQNNAATGTHFVMELASGKMIFTDPSPTKIYSTAAIDERTLLTRDGKFVLINRHGKSYSEPGTYGDDVLYEVDSGTELWRRRNQCEMFML
ncbi:MAG: protein kinase, partial [Lachnospiraceae bacterium]